MPFPEGAAALTAMITPTLFLTATGSLIISTSNRMSRIADRIRILNTLGDDLSRGKSDLDFPGERLDHVASQVGKLLWRSNRIRLTLTLLYLSLAMFVGTDLTIALHVIAGSDAFPVPTALAIVGVLLLLVASLHLAREAHASLRSNREEVEFYADLRRRRRGNIRVKDAAEGT